MDVLIGLGLISSALSQAKTKKAERRSNFFIALKLNSKTKKTSLTYLLTYLRGLEAKQLNVEDFTEFWTPN